MLLDDYWERMNIKVPIYFSSGLANHPQSSFEKNSADLYLLKIAVSKDQFVFFFFQV